MIFKGFDIYELNYELTSEEFGILNTNKENLPKRGILIRLLSLLKSTFKSFKPLKLNSFITDEANIFFSLNDNEKKVYNNLQNLKDPCFIIGKDRFSNGFPLAKIHFLSFLFVPLVLFHFIRTSDPTKKMSFKYAFDAFCLTYAAILIVPGYLNKLKPKKIFLSNHTRPLHRLIIELNKNNELGYIQHASFIEKMKPFKGFNYLLIDGYDSLNKLINSNSINNRIFLVGNSKYDHFLNYKKSKKEISSIGICINNLDSLEEIYKLIKHIKDQETSLKLFIRPHPSDPRFLQLKKYCTQSSIFFSNSKTIDSFNFLKQIDILIAGDSNIHLESICMDIPSIYLNLKKRKTDWYGFLKLGFLYNGTSINQIINTISKINHEKLNYRNLLKPFNSSINTPFEGKSALLALNIIDNNKRFIRNNFNKTIDLNNNLIYNIKPYNE